MYVSKVNFHMYVQLNIEWQQHVMDLTVGVLQKQRPNLGANAIQNHLKYFICASLTLPVAIEPIERSQKSKHRPPGNRGQAKTNA
jgi:hypothetical protein